MSTRDLVDALIAGDSIAIENSFNDVMTDKVSAALDDYRVEVAKNLFNPAQEQAEEISTEE